MPRAFHSVSHGTVAFGFFNVRSDIMLLERRLFFADGFCGAVTRLARRAGREARREEMAGFEVDGAAALGSLHGAMAGRDHSGLIGATYLLFPFPHSPEGFRQDPDGSSTRDAIVAIARRFARPSTVGLEWAAGRGHLLVDEYAFAPGEVRRLLDYVERGGMPGWREGTRPGCVTAMMEAVDREKPPWVTAR